MQLDLRELERQIEKKIFTFQLKKQQQQQQKTLFIFYITRT